MRFPFSSFMPSRSLVGSHQPKHLRRKPSRILAVHEALERRVLLSAALSNADLSGPWTVAGMDTAGTAMFDGNGNITGGMFTHADGSTDTPSGTYSITPTGALTISSQDTIVGGINSTTDVAAISEATKPNNLNVLVNSSD